MANKDEESQVELRGAVPDVVKVRCSLQGRKFFSGDSDKGGEIKFIFDATSAPNIFILWQYFTEADLEITVRRK